MARPKQLTAKGTVRMVDIGAKPVTEREARASACIWMRPETLKQILAGKMAKGNVLEVARLAGIMAAKKTSEIIPLCHPLNISVAQVELEPDFETSCLKIETMVRLCGKTGAEMEALTAATAAALTVYDMCKGVDKEMVIGEVQLMMKKGGRSGLYLRRKDSS